MTFPVYIPIGPWAIHAHWVFESLSYLIGFRLYLWLRARRGDALPLLSRMWIVAAGISGAAIGSKVLYWLSDPWTLLQHRHELYYWLAGKTIVGGLIGGLLMIEWAKGRLGITRSTGDLFAIPLPIGMAIGRIGCFLSGLGDHTYGLPTSLPWGVNFGDGIPRHPTQLYEIAFLIPLAIWLWQCARRPYQEGDLFKYFMAAYLSFRWLLEFIKPGVPLLGLTAIQWACLAMLLSYRRDIHRWVSKWEAVHA